MTTTPQKINADGEVFKLLNIIESSSQALETFQNNAEQALSEENLVNILKRAMENDDFRKAFVNAIVSQLTSARIVREIVAESKDTMREAIHARVQALMTTEALAPAVSQILSMVSNGNLPELPDVIIQRRVEDIKPDSVENVKEILEILAGDKAWK